MVPEHWQRHYLLPEGKMNEIKRRVEHMKMYCISTPETEESFTEVMNLLSGLKLV